MMFFISDEKPRASPNTSEDLAIVEVYKCTENKRRSNCSSVIPDTHSAQEVAIPERKELAALSVCCQDTAPEQCSVSFFRTAFKNINLRQNWPNSQLQSLESVCDISNTSVYLNSSFVS